MTKKPSYEELEKRVRELEKTVHTLKHEKKHGQHEKIAADGKHRFKELEASLRLTQFCFDSAAIGIYHIQSDGRVLNVNAHAAEMLGYTVEELSGLYVWDIDPSINRDTFDEGWRRLATKQAQFFESTSIKKNGSRIHVGLTTNLLEYDGRQFIVSFVQDITERKHIEKSLNITQFSFDNANVGIYRIATDGQIIEVNRKAAALLGYTKEELEELSIMAVDPAVTHESWAQACKILSEDSPYDQERKHRRKDGRVIPVEILAKCLEYDGQQYIYAFVQDISKRKQAEKTLRENERLLSNILESVKEGLFVLDNNFKCTLYNSSMEKLTGVAKEMVVGKTPWEALPSLKNTSIEQNIINSMNGKTTENMEIRISLPNKETAWFHDSFSPLRNSDGKILGVVCVVGDITQRKQAEIEKERLLKELQEALENVKTLSGLLPICASCKKIRDDKGYWNQIESYIQDHSGAEFSHSICPDCVKKLYPDYKPHSN